VGDKRRSLAPDFGGYVVDRAKLTNTEVDKLVSDGKRKRVWDSHIPGFNAIVTKSGHKSFYYRYRWNGQVRDFRLGTYGAITTTQARKLALMAAGDVARGVDIQVRKKNEKIAEARKRRSTLGKFVEQVYGPYLTLEKKSGDQMLARMQSCFGQWYSLPMSEISEWKAKRWRQEQLKRGLKPGTANRALAVLRACLNYAYRLRIIDSHPLQLLKPLKEDRIGVTRYLSPDEEIRLRKTLVKREKNLRAARHRYNEWLAERNRPPIPVPPDIGYFDHLQPLVMLAINTGYRKGELLSLQWRYYDPNANTISVVGENTKNRNSRHLPLNKEARLVMRQWRRQNPGSKYVFENPATGAPITDISNAWTKLREDAGLSNFRFHDLRHHFASSLAMAGVDLNTIRDLLGHSDLQMTLRYAHLAPAHHAAAVAVLDRHPDESRVV